MSKQTMWIVALAMVVATGTFAGPERVEFPKDYKASFSLVTTRDMHRGNNTVVDIYANPVAVKGGKADLLPSGSIILMEAYAAKVDDRQQPVFDKDGRMIKGELRGIVMMEKRAGWGTIYPDEQRNGDWEYAAFSIDGVRRTNPTTECFACHGALKDFDFIYTKHELGELAK